jgi:hypothetical protein
MSKISDMICELQDAKKSAKKTLRKWEKNREKARKADKGRCRICGFDVVTEVHHIIPVSQRGPGWLPNLITLCPNHHAMADRGLISVEELKRAIENREHSGRLFSTHELLEKIAGRWPGMDATARELEDFRAWLKAEVPNGFATIYGLSNEKVSRHMRDLFNSKFDEEFLKVGKPQ